MSSFRTLNEAPGKSNFVQTCNLLSQYVKEKGSLRDLNIELGGKLGSLESIVKPGPSRSASALNTQIFNSVKSVQKVRKLSPISKVEDVSNKTSTRDGATTNCKPAQLTIFYSGKVLVFDDYPENMARELMSIAKKGSSQMSCGNLLNNTAASTSSSMEGVLQTTTRKAIPALTLNLGGEQLSVPQSECSGSHLPIARRSSLHRFLEKRKDRAAGRGPYHNQDQRASSDRQFDLNL